MYDVIKLTPRIVRDLEMIQTIDDEWRAIPNYCDILMLNVNDQTDDFWGKLSTMKDGDNTFLFKNVADYVLKVLSIPPSNTTCERVFSKVNLIKTKIRNKLITVTVNGILLTSECVKSAGNCTRFTANETMLST